MKITDLFKKVEAFNEIANYAYVEKVCVRLLDHANSAVERCYNVKQFRRYIKKHHDKEVSKQVMQFDGWELNTPIAFAFAESESFTYSIRIVPRLDNNR